MNRNGTRRSVRGYGPVLVLVAVLALLAGGLPALVASPGSGSHPGLAVQAPGSQGSVHQLPWWDPRGWFGGGGGGAPAAHTIADYKPPVARPPGRVAGQGPHKPAHRVRELTSERTEYSSTYEMSDGTRQQVISAGPVNYQTSSGQWAPISTKVQRSRKAGFAFQDVANTFGSYFGSSAAQLVRFDAPGGGWVRIGLAGAHVAAPKASGSTVTYAVAPGVSLSYTVTPQSLVERISLASPVAAKSLASLRFTVQAGGGLTAQPRQNGSVTLSRGAMPVLTLPAPFMTDAREDASSPYGFAWSPKVAQHVTRDAKTGTLTLAVTPSAAWLGAAARKYPVVIDPTITVSPTPADAQNTMIESDTATTNYGTSSWRLSVGTTAAAVVRSLLSFPLGAGPTDSPLTSASLRLYYDQTFGPGTSNQTVRVDQATSAWSASTATWSNASGDDGTAGPSLTVNPNTDNIWDSYTVTSIVQSWLSGTSANDGFVVRAANESAPNVGGPRYEASFNAYNGETATYPQLVLTWGVPGVTPDPITTIHATGAVLNWQPYVNSTGNTGNDLAEYQVYRSVSQSFIPAANTLVAPVPVGTTTFTDTTNTPTPPGGIGNAFYYMIAVKTTNGTIIPGPVQLVRLPTAGSTTQIINASGATSLSSAEPATVQQHITGQPWTSVGDDSATLGTTRSVFSFPSMASAGIPADATVSEAHLKLWGFYNDTAAGAKYDAYELTQSFTPSQATWDDASTGTAWTTAGGTFSSTLQSQVTGLTNDPARQNWPVTAAVQDWTGTPADEHGLIVKLDSSAIAERELFMDTTGAEPALRPELVVTYTEPTAADTYYSPSLPDPMSSATSYTVPVTLTNTTSSTWSNSDWVLSYHWLAPDGTDVSASADQAQTALPASMAPSSVATVNATIKTPDTSTSGDARSGYQLAWDLFDKTTGTWLSSGTSTPALTAAAAKAAQAKLAASAVTAARPRITTATAAAGGQTVAPLDQVTSVTRSASDLLGLEQYYQYTGVNTGSGSSLLNNDATGNVNWNYNAFSNPSRGFQTFVRLDYNSMDTSESSMGFGWSLQTSTLQRLGTPLEFHPAGNPTQVTLTDGDGTTHTFTYNSSDSTWTSPPGLHYYLQDTDSAACSANGKDPVSDAWTMTAPDRTQFDFDCNGYQTSVTDKNGNTATFTYTQKNSNNSPVEHLDYITDPAGRQTLTIGYYGKGDSTYSYVDDSTGNLVSATNLTNPDIIDQVKSITAIPQSATATPRTITFYYDTEGLMSQMTDGDGTSATKTFKFAYDMTQGNKNVKLVKVTDPRGNATGLAYYTAPQDPTFKWSLETITDRMTRATGFAYSVPSGGGIQTVVTDPKNNTTTYLMDASGRPVQSTDAKNQVTKLGWDSDNNVTSLTEDNDAQTTWTYDPLTGYPLTMKDAQANHDGTAGTTYTYQTAPNTNGHVADLISELTPQQRLWTFGYDPNGNVTSVTKPLGNASGAASGSYTTKYTYDSTGDLLTSTDPDGNETKYGPSYDPTGYPLTVTDPLGNATAYTYDQTGDVTSVTDPLKNGTSTYAWDVFGRPLQSTVPKTSTVSITTPAPVYDGNDNVTQSTAPNGAVTTYSYDADDELSSKVTPADTSGGTAPETTYTYDADGNLHTQTAPKGNVSGATAGSYTTTYGYDAINELTSVTDPASDETQYGYDDVGNQASVTDPRNNQTQYAYNLNHQVTQVTDPAQHTTKTGYDLDGNVISTTDQNNNTTQYTLDADGQVTQQEVPAQAPGAAISYDVTQYVYDQDGNQTQVISPRGSAAGVTVTSSCVSSGTCPYTSQTQYNPDGQVKDVQAPYLPGDPTYGTAAQTSYSYNADGQLTSVTAPASNGSSSAPNVTSYSYFDNGWVQSSTDPTGIVTSYDYNALGEQASRQIDSAGGAMSRTMNWGYYPDGNLESESDDGVPTGLYSELVDDTDTGASATGAWTTATCTAGTNGCETYQYETHAAGSGSDKFTWNLDVPAAGNYTVYVKYPVVSGAVSNAAYTVKYNGGSAAATATVDQTSDNGGGWVSLGKWAFTQGGNGQQVSLAENSGGTAVAGAVEIVRDNSGDTNTATHGYTYTYDPDGNATTVTDSSPGAAVASYKMGYDQLDRTTSVEEDNSSGTAVHTTTYGYDAASNLASQTHDGAPSTYDYNNLNQLSQETDAKSSTDTSPQVTGFTYTPTGQVATETKPNGNVVTSTYYANNLPYTAIENTSGGTLVSSHTYAYDPDGNKSQDAEKLMSADSSGSYLSHTLDYTYDPQDQVTSVSTDGTVTESYTHDSEGDVTAQTVNGTSTSYDFVLGRMESATADGATADYNYDPIGRLDTVTSGGTTIQSNTYDGFDNLASTSQLNTSTNSMDTTSYTYDSLNQMATQTTGAGTTSFSYLGTSGEVASEQDPGGVSKTYDYTPSGARLSQDTTGGTGTTGYGYYSYNSHSDVEALTGANGDTTATYGYTAYGNPVTSMFTGADKNDATSSSSSTTQPYNSYRFNAMRWDSTSGSYDMGFRNYDPSLNQFASRDMYDGALSDMGLSDDPFTGSLYAFGDGNPVSNTELNGHTFLAPAGGGTTTTSTSCLGPEIGAGCGSSISNLFDVPAGSGSGSTSTPSTTIGASPSNPPQFGLVAPPVSVAPPVEAPPEAPSGNPLIAMLGLVGALVSGDSAQPQQPLQVDTKQRSQGCFGESGAGSSTIYYNLDYSQGRGRASGVEACLGPFTAFNIDERPPPTPPGFQPGMDRSHLLAREFGGLSIPQNIVPLWSNANQVTMRNVEYKVEGLLALGQRVYYMAAPLYGPADSYVPIGINITYGSAASGLRPVFVPNEP
jgi:RHS repeat-associated protein